MDTVPLWLIIATVAVYCGFLIGYGETVFGDVESGDCGLTSIGDIVDCFQFAGGMIGTMFDFLTLGGFSSPLPLLIQGPLVLFFGIAWGITILEAIGNIVGAAAGAL